MSTELPHRPSRSRHGAALVLAILTATLLSAIAIALSSLSVANFQQQNYRNSQIKLQVGADSCANEAVLWMSQGAGLSAIQALPPEPLVVNAAQIGITGTYNPEMVYTNVMALESYTPSAVIDSKTTTLFGTTLYGNPTAINEPGWGLNLRDSCTVRAQIVCLATTKSGDSFPDGNERYLVLVTVQQGSLSTDPDNYMRRRVMALIKASATHVFGQDMYAISGYDVGGSAGTDSWPGSTAYNPANSGNASLGYDSGNVSSGGTITTSGSSTVDGSITSNLSLALPSFTYAPPAGISNLGTVSSNTTLTGPTTVRMTSLNANLVIGGSGTVNLYVDGPFNTSSLTFASGSTASVVVMQNNYSSTLGGSSISLNGGAVVGDVSTSGGTYTANPARFEYISNAVQTVTLNGNGMMAAVIYAPYSTFNMKGTFQFFGSMVADSFGGKVNGTFNFHYDQALANLALPLNVQLSSSLWNSYPLSVVQQ